jgi:hypothetical protein
MRGTTAGTFRRCRSKPSGEAVVNAVIHRDYAITGSQVLLEVFDDRIVTSPSALPNHITVEQARSGGAPRSRNAESVEQRGEGHSEHESVESRQRR